MARASQVRIYRSQPTDCAGRALASTETYARSRQRRKRIERLFGHLKRNMKLRSLKLRGLAGAAEEFTMAAAGYNLQLLANRAAPA